MEAQRQDLQAEKQDAINQVGFILRCSYFQGLFTLPKACFACLEQSRTVHSHLSTILPACRNVVVERSDRIQGLLTSRSWHVRAATGGASARAGRVGGEAESRSGGHRGGADRARRRQGCC